MKKNKSILNYFNSRNAKIHLNQNRSRHALAENEVTNFEFLLKKNFNRDILDKKILDVGCGDCFLKKPFELRGYNYTGIDIDTIDFNTDQFLFDDNSFDLIICLAVIEHVENPSFFISEIFRTMKKNAILFISTPNWTYSHKSFYDDYTHVRPYTKKSLEKILDDNNFKNISILPGYRNKPYWMYVIPFSNFFANLLPFNNDFKFAPNFLKGRSTSIFAIAQKIK